MDARELAKIDLNLLTSLHILLEEKNVSRAAERLFITQPAMSKTLSRLREVFGDPLFTRSSHGMQPTPRAEELALDLANILGNIHQLVAGGQFDPAAYRGEITLALSEYIGVTMLPELVQKLAKQAPLLSIKVITRVENQLEQLALGKLDLAIHMEYAQYSDEFRVAKLGGSPAALLMRDDHPLSSGTITWQRLARFPLIRLYISDREQLEIQRRSDFAARLQDSQRGSLETTHLLTALEVLRNSDHVMPAPAYILQNEPATRGITAQPVPGNDDYSVRYALVAHRRTANSPLHNWLWEQITCTIAELRTPLPRKLRQRVAAGSSDPPQ